MGDPKSAEHARALSLVPRGMFVMASAFDGSRAGILVSWAQRCATEPPLIAVAVRKGRPIEPIIRDSRAFALSLVDPRDTFIRKKLAESDEHAGGVLDALACETLKTGSPCLTRAVAAFDCAVERHLDIEADHEMYIGLVVGSKIYDEAAAAGHIGSQTDWPRAG